MTLAAKQRRAVAESVRADIGAFVRVGHVATLALAGQTDFRSLAQSIAVAVRADRLAIVRYDPAPDRHDIVFDFGGVDHVKLAALISTAASGEVGSLKTYSGQYSQKVTVLLGRSEGHADVLFLAGADPSVTELLGHELAFLWARRRKGLVTEMLGKDDASRTTQGKAILSAENPFALTRAEARVCQSLADGLRPAEITQRLQVSLPTVRSHLRSIYAKTGLDGMVAVVHRLHEDARAA